MFTILAVVLTTASLTYKCSSFPLQSCHVSSSKMILASTSGLHGAKVEDGIVSRPVITEGSSQDHYDTHGFLTGDDNDGYRGSSGGDSMNMNSKRRRSVKKKSLSEPIKMIMDDQREYEMNIGKAVDTLKKDYPKILTQDVDYSIYHPDLVVVDPSGVTLQGVQTYKGSFSFLHTVVNFFYCEEASGVTFRLVYDWARNNVRVSWNAVLVPKIIYGGVRNKLYVDGISVYEVDRMSGLISKHSIERLVVNDSPVRSPQGVLHGLAAEIINPSGGEVPVLGLAGADNSNTNFAFKNNFQMSMSSSDNSSDISSEDAAEFDRKNLARKKFGLPPITIDEFLKLQAEVSQQREAVQESLRKQQLAKQMEEEKKKKEGNIFTKMFEKATKDECESNWDCERPLVCCDLIVKKMCCNSGMKVNNFGPGDLAEVRVTDGYPQEPVYDDRGRTPY